ncbi:DNA topoisomerase I, mitochondrial [Varanus komodoensis]|nr:DNA topoisomerase I, mitochondrial [Varanus komodoensis]
MAPKDVLAQAIAAHGCARQQAKEMPLFPKRNREAMEEIPERVKKERVSGAEVERGDPQEDCWGSPCNVLAVEHRDLKGAREQKRRMKCLRGVKEAPGEEDPEGRGCRKRELKARQDSDGESWGSGESSGEETQEEGAEAGRGLGKPFGIRLEERRSLRKKRSEGEEAEDGGAGGKAKRSRSKRATLSTGPERGSQKRKAEEEEREETAKKKKEEGHRNEKEKTEQDKWKWWEEEKRQDGVKWQQLEHRGPYFAPPYEPLPDGVHFYYGGKPLKLSPPAEEVATFFAKMLDHEYTAKKIFQSNFFNDWTKEMTPEERKRIKDLRKCDFQEMHKYFVEKHEAQKALPKEEKQKLKEESEKIQEEYGFCIIDGHREKIGNFKIEPPGLFRGRGDHPKMGMLKKRVMPEDVIINCSKDSKIPQPPPGHRWKEVRCDNTVTWLASWTENIQGSIKYIMLNPSSKLKGEKDWQKYEVARRLKGVVGKIRSQYRADWRSREMKQRQRSVALYFIDKLALRAGNEKEEGETADTVGCCSLRVEHVALHPWLDGKEHVVEFDFLGKDCIRYCNRVPVERQVSGRSVGLPRPGRSAGLWSTWGAALPRTAQQEELWRRKHTSGAAGSRPHGSRGAPACPAALQPGSSPVPKPETQAQQPL